MNREIYLNIRRYFLTCIKVKLITNLNNPTTNVAPGHAD